MSDNVEIRQITDCLYQYTNYITGNIVAGTKDHMFQVADAEHKVHVWKIFFPDTVELGPAPCDHNYREMGFMISYIACTKCERKQSG